MSLAHPDAERIATLYLSMRDAEIVARCGYGKEGVVFKSSRGTAVKVHSTLVTFKKEYLAYQRLAEAKAEVVLGFSVPRPINADADLKVIEMGIVEPPFILDFGSSAVDIEPDYTPEQWQEWWLKLEHDFEDRFPQAEAVFYYLKRHFNIWHLDLSTNNLQFSREDSPGSGKVRM